MARDIPRLLDTLASTLTALREALTPAPPKVKTPKGRKAQLQNAKNPISPSAAPKTTAASRVRRKTKTPNPRLVLQAKYMVAVRGLSAANKAKVKKVLAADGVEAAITLAQSKRA